MIAPEVKRKLKLWKPRQPPDDWPDWYRWDGGWYEMDGEHTRYTVWDELKAGDVVLDVGGYRGQFVVLMLEKYPACVYYSFEPSPVSFAAMQERLGGYDNVKLFNFGLGATNRTGTLYDSERDSATFVDGTPIAIVEARIVDVAQFWKQHNITRVALMELNIEGGEFELLPYMLELGLLEQIERMMIQWHSVVSRSAKKQLEIQSAIAKSHEMIWNLGAWEGWRLRNLSSGSVAEPSTACILDTS
jgi:FkbM family methyltransferase